MNINGFECAHVFYLFQTGCALVFPQVVNVYLLTYRLTGTVSITTFLNLKKMPGQYHTQQKCLRQSIVL